MHNMLYWKVEAFIFKNGCYELQEYGSGFRYDQARSYYLDLYDSDKFAMLRMSRLDGSETWSIENKEAA